MRNFEDSAKNEETISFGSLEFIQSGVSETVSRYTTNALILPVKDGQSLARLPRQKRHQQVQLVGRVCPIYLPCVWLLWLVGVNCRQSLA